MAKHELDELNREVEATSFFENPENAELVSDGENSESSETGLENLYGRDFKKALRDKDKQEKQEYKQAIKESKAQEKAELEDIKRRKVNKKNYKIAHHRHLKNFGWWFFGFISCIVIFVGSICAALFLIPVKTFTGNESDKYVSKEIAESSLFEALMGLPSYKVEEVPAIKLLFDTLCDIDITGDFKVGDIVEINFDELNDKTIISSDFLKGFLDNIKIIASISSLHGEDWLGDIGKMSVFTDYEQVKPEDIPLEGSTDFNAKLFYYQDDEGVYKRAYNDSHKLLPEAEGKDLFYPALNDIVFTELIDIFVDRADGIVVKELLSSLGMEETGAISKIVGDKTIRDMKNFDINEVKLSVIFELPEESADNYEMISNLYKIILDSNGIEYNDETFKEKCDEVCIGDLTNVDTEKIRLISVLPESGNEQLYDILRSITEVDNNKDITLKDLTSTDMSKIKLTAVMPKTEDNAQIYDILCDMAGKADVNELTVADLSGADVNSLKLSSVMPENENTKQLYDVLSDLTGKEKNEITVGDLSNPNINDLKLTSVMPYSDDNKHLYNILIDMTGKASDEITVGDLTGVEIEKIKLVNLLSESDNEKLYGILRDMTGVDENSKIVVGDFTKSDVTHIRLYNVLEYDGNEKTYAILGDMAYENLIEQIIVDTIIEEKIANGELFENSSGDFVPYGDLNYTEKAQVVLSMKAYYNSLGASEKATRRENAVTEYESLSKEEKYKTITLASLDDAKVGAIKVSSVVSYSEKNKQLYDILCDLTGKTKEELIVSDLQEIEFSNVKLTSVLAYDEEKNGKLYNVLQDITAKDKDEVTLGDLENVTFDNVKLTTILPATADNQELYNILLDATGSASADSITVSSLNTIDVSNIKLKTVMGDSTDNVIINAILSDDEATVGNIGDKINELTLTELYGDNVFTNDVSKAFIYADGKIASYTKSGNTYTKSAILEGVESSSDLTSDDNVYYVSKDASIWIFMIYNCSAFDEEGFGTSFTANGLKLKNINSSIDNIGDAMKTATVRELVTAGILQNTSYHTAIKNMYPNTMSDLFN